MTFTNPSEIPQTGMGRLYRRLSAPAATVWVLLAGALLCLPCLLSGLSLDDYFFKTVMLRPGALPGLPRPPFDVFAFIRGDVQQIRQAMELGLLPWWTYFQEYQFAFWRPLSSLTHWIDFRLFPEQAWLMHAHNIAWYVLLGAVLARLYRRWLSPPWVAVLAALLYMVDDAHGPPVAFISNRNALVAAALGFYSLLAHDGWRRSHRPLQAGLAWAAYALALLSGESAIAVCGYLLAYALCLDTGRLRERLLSLAPYAAITLGWRALYSWLGYRAGGAGLYIDPLGEPLRFLGEFVQRLPVLLMGQLALPNSALWV
ncbi:hypothetical protein ACFL43_06810, partial [Thermodesulfobacteriota bacterium]